MKKKSLKAKEGRRNGRREAGRQKPSSLRAPN